MISVLKAPFCGANDTEGVLIGWDVAEGEKVSAGRRVASVETTKVAVDVTIEMAGILYPLVQAGARIAVGQAIALISDEALLDPVREYERISAKGAVAAGGGITLKAKSLLAAHGISPEQARSVVKDGNITEATVDTILAAISGSATRKGFGFRKRIGIVGGVSGGGALIVIDSVIRSPEQQAICIFDANREFHGQHILGVPVVGSVEDRLFPMLQSGELDGVVIAFNRNLKEREAMYVKLKQADVPFMNVVDPDANIRSGVIFGTGNIILSGVYLGAGTRLGDNNFVTAGVHIEHGNVIGNHCAFGPGIFTSGNVTIGSRVRFAAGISVEPSLHIGDDCVIGSGNVVLEDLAPGAVLKSMLRTARERSS